MPVREGALAVLVCLSFLAASVLAAPMARGNLHRLLACRRIAANDARLKCFDAAAAALARVDSGARSTTSVDGESGAARRPPGAGEVPAAAASDQRTAAFNPQRTFGLSSSAILAREVAAGARRKPISHISARVTRLRQAPDGRMVYWLANGQVWEELLDNGDAPPVKAGEQLKISRGWLDSYWMQTPAGRGCKVERLR